MIKNDLQFKIYFYEWIALCCASADEFMISFYQDAMKGYLLTPGFKSFIRDEHGITKQVLFHDLDELYSNYLKYGQI